MLCLVLCGCGRGAISTPLRLLVGVIVRAAREYQRVCVKANVCRRDALQAAKTQNLILIAYAVEVFSAAFFCILPCSCCVAAVGGAISTPLRWFVGGGNSFCGNGISKSFRRSGRQTFVHKSPFFFILIVKNAIILFYFCSKMGLFCVYCRKILFIVNKY